MITETQETQETHQSARTRFTIEAKGVRYAYRRFGKETGVPLLFLQHFLGTMDNWDPAVTDGLAENRPIILFDSAGIGRSGGQTPNSIAEMPPSRSSACRPARADQRRLIRLLLGGICSATACTGPPQS